MDPPADPQEEAEPEEESPFPPIHQINTKYWCIYCGGNLLLADDFDSHYAKYHPNIVAYDCYICRNRFDHASKSEFHAQRRYHRGVPYEKALEAFGANLFVGITPLQFHRLKKNNIPVPTDIVEPEEPDDPGYLPLDAALAEMKEAIKRRKKEDTLVGKLKDKVKKISARKKANELFVSSSQH